MVEKFSLNLAINQMYTLYSNERYDFIVSKYKDKKYINFSPFYGQAANLGEVRNFPSRSSSFSNILEFK